MERLITALHAPHCYPHPVDRVRLIETHISWLLLTGHYAYKIKKPVALGFVDFSSLERRRRFCIEELRLNRRLAPALYLGVVPICGTPDAPIIGGRGDVIEYAVKMREFRQEDLLDRALAEDRLTAAHIDQLADRCATFHAHAVQAPAHFGSPAGVLSAALDNFSAIAQRIGDAGERARIDELGRWTETEHAKLIPALLTRQRSERIRECHGDMHLGNMALIDGTPTLFDCIEFNDNLRYIDVISDVAFLVMDLVARGRRDYAYRYLNRYLEASGDYAGSVPLNFYLVYRAMVRAKIDAIRARQSGLSPQAQARERRDFSARITLAESFAARAKPFLAITCGLSGSGKTHVSQIMLERAGAIRIRSDVERKRLFRMSAAQRSLSELGGGIYAEHATEQTFAKLLELAATVIGAGFPVLVDATFLKCDRRRQFQTLASTLAAPFVILHCVAPQALLEQRIARRHTEAQDASEATVDVLRRQQAEADALAADEHRLALQIDTHNDASIDAAADRLSAMART